MIRLHHDVYTTCGSTIAHTHYTFVGDELITRVRHPTVTLRTSTITNDLYIIVPIYHVLDTFIFRYVCGVRNTRVL